MRQIILLGFVLTFFGCGDHLTKLSKSDKLPEHSYRTFRLLANTFERSPDGLTLKLKEKYLVNEIERKRAIDELNYSVHANIAPYRSQIDLSKTDIIEVFGKPTYETIAKGVALQYYILNKTCYFDESGQRIHENDCGTMTFKFDESGKELISVSFFIKQ